MDWVNEDGTRCDPQPPDEEQEAIRRLATGEMPSYSTGICGGTTCGYGALDEHGYWEFPLPPAFWKVPNK